MTELLDDVDLLECAAKSEEYRAGIMKRVNEYDEPLDKHLGHDSDKEKRQLESTSQKNKSMIKTREPLAYVLMLDRSSSMLRAMSLMKIDAKAFVTIQK